jgi:predicted enzyme related to lactoylglutathione lyase
MTYLAVDDILAAQTRAEKAGGEILRPAFRLPGVGRLSVVSDTAGAIIGLIQPEGVVPEGRPPVH